MIVFSSGENVDETITQNQISNVNSRTLASAFDDFVRELTTRTSIIALLIMLKHGQNSLVHI